MPRRSRSSPPLGVVGRGPGAAGHIHRMEHSLARKFHTRAGYGRTGSKGLSLIEVLIVVAIVGVVAMIAVPSYQDYVERSKVAQAEVDLRTIEQAIARYQADHNGTSPPALSAVKGVGTKDPWGNAYRYLNIATASNKALIRKDRFLVPINTDFDLYSMGRDGASKGPLTAKASRDDVIRANNGVYIGLADGY